MDKIVDHIHVFHGDAVIQDFPGNYSEYREWLKSAKKEENIKSLPVVNTPSKNTSHPEKTSPKKLTYKEQREFESLEAEITALEVEKEALETALSSGNLPLDVLTRQSHRIGEIIELIDTKTMRWLELSEKG
jgi:ATP-binding cassette subfamily F protein uup